MTKNNYITGLFITAFMLSFFFSQPAKGVEVGVSAVVTGTGTNLPPTVKITSPSQMDLNTFTYFTKGGSATYIDFKLEDFKKTSTSDDTLIPSDDDLTYTITTDYGTVSINNSSPVKSGWTDQFLFIAPEASTVPNEDKFFFITLTINDGAEKDANGVVTANIITKKLKIYAY